MSFFNSLSVPLLLCIQCIYSYEWFATNLKCNKEMVISSILPEIKLLPSLLSEHFSNLSKNFEEYLVEDMDIIAANSSYKDISTATSQRPQISEITMLTFPHFFEAINSTKSIRRRVLETKLNELASIFNKSQTEFSAIQGNYSSFMHSSFVQVRKNLTKVLDKLSAFQVTVDAAQRRVNCTDFFNTSSSETGIPRDCSEALARGNAKSGETLIQVHPSLEPQTVWCNHSWDGGKWTVILRRRPQKFQLDFRRPFSDYEEGFGSPDKEYWIGLKAMHHITSRRPNELFVSMSIPGDEAFAKYKYFRVGEPTDYELHVSGYDEASTAGNSLSYHNRMLFSTFDFDRDKDEVRSCSVNSGGGGFWFNFCYYANPTGVYPPKGIPNETALNSMLEWRRWKGFHTYLSTLVMMIRPTKLRRHRKRRFP